MQLVNGKWKEGEIKQRTIFFFFIGMLEVPIDHSFEFY